MQTTTTSRKIIFGAVTLFIIALGLFIFFLLKSRQVSVLYGDNTVANNIQFASELNSLETEQFRFFTGTNIGSFPKQSLDVKNPKSTAEWPEEIPFDAVSKVIEDSSKLFVYGQVLKDNEFFGKTPATSKISVVKGEQRWYVIDGGKIDSQPFSNRVVLDLRPHENHLYGLVKLDQNNRQILKYDYNTKQTSTIIGKTQISTLVGANESWLYGRNYSGKVFSIDLAANNTISEIADSVGDLWYDSTTQKLIYSLVNSGTASDEGGERTTSTGSTELTVFDPNNSKREIVTMQMPVFINQGYILSPDSSSKIFQAYELDSGDLSEIELVKERPVSVKDVVILEKNLSKVAVITGQNQLLLYGAAAPKDDQIRYPNFNPSNPFTFDYRIAKSDLIISAPQATQRYFLQSLAALKNTCGCDINQLAKRWVVSGRTLNQPTQPSSGTVVEDNYGGDGVPPEQQPR